MTQEYEMSPEELRLLDMAAGRYRTGVPLVEPRVEAPAAAVTTSPPVSNSPSTLSGSTELFQPPVPYPHWNENWDLKQQIYDQGKTGQTRRLLWVRHGKYLDRETEAEDKVLDDVGVKQAELTAKHLAKIVKNEGVPIVSIRSSALVRAKETAEIISTRLGLTMSEPDAMLNETL
jgi:hypothetical protein